MADIQRTGEENVQRISQADREADDFTTQLNTLGEFPKGTTITDIPPTTRSWVLGLIPNQQIQTFIVRKTYLDFQTAGLTKDIILFSLPKLGEIQTCWFNVVVAFAGTTTATISVGKDSAETGLQTAQDVKTTGLKLAIGTDFTTNRPVFSTTTFTNIEAKATATVENLSSLSAGVVDFYFNYVTYATLY